MSNKHNFRIHRFELGPMENFIYLIEDVATRRTAVVDPAWDVETITEFADQSDLRITDVLLTHSHHDHINGVDQLLSHSDAAVHLLKQESAFWGEKSIPLKTHSGGDRLHLGETEIEIMHTPGHTPGSACYRLGEEIITGDTLFVFGCGRCDLKGGDPEEMFVTLKRMRHELPTDTTIHPGHNYAETETSTLKEQLEGNPFMQFRDVTRFVHYRMHEHDRVRQSPYGPVKIEN